MADTLLGGIVINEVLVDPNGSINFDTDGNGTAADTDEFIELYNSSTSAIDISGLEMWDAGIGHYFTFPPGTIMQPGAHAMIMSGVQTGGSLPTSSNPDDLFFDLGRGTAFINNGGDNIVIYDPTNDEYIIARFNGDPFDNPALGSVGYRGFSSTATRSGSGEDFGRDTDGLSIQRAGDGSNTFTSDTPTPGTTNVCFVAGTQLRTPAGTIAVEDIRPGTLLLTQDNGIQPVQWLWSRRWSVAMMREFPNLAPVRICAGALGNGLPLRDLWLSQQHRVLVRGPIAQRMFCAAEVLVAAKHLVALPGISIESPDHDITYFHIMPPRHELLIAEGTLTESLYLGKEALGSIPRAQLRELQSILGFNAHQLAQNAPAPVRLFANGKRARQLVARHVENRKPLVAPQTC